MQKTGKLSCPELGIESVKSFLGYILLVCLCIFYIAGAAMVLQKDRAMCYDFTLLQHFFNLLLDELIRQVTINCAERGLLLLRVRDEIRMTIAAYQTLYESSVAFGMRKALQAEQGKADMEKKVSTVHNRMDRSSTGLE